MHMYDHDMKNIYMHINTKRICSVNMLRRGTTINSSTRYSIYYLILLIKVDRGKGMN